MVSNLFPPYHGGGYGELCFQLAEGLRERGHDVTVLTTVPLWKCPHPGGHSVSVRVLRRLVNVGSAKSAKLFVRTLRNRQAVVGALRRTKPDVWVLFSVDGIGLDVYSALATSHVPGAVVVGDTWLAQAWRDPGRFDPWMGMAMGRGRGGWPSVLKRLVGSVGRSVGLSTDIPRRRPVTSLAISTFLMQDLAAIPVPLTSDSTEMRYPLPDAFFGGESGHGRAEPTGQPLRALFISRMEMLKGPDTAILAVAMAVRSGADITLTLAGIGSEGMARELAVLAAHEGIADRVRRTEVPDQRSLIQLYRDHDVFLFPSRIVEGLGIVCVEAMACGLPVLGTDAGGQTDVIKDGETGFLFKPADAAGLAGLLRRLHDDRALLKKLSGAAIRMASGYRRESVLDVVERTLESSSHSERNPNTEQSTGVAVGFGGNRAMSLGSIP